MTAAQTEVIWLYSAAQQDAMPMAKVIDMRGGDSRVIDLGLGSEMRWWIGKIGCPTPRCPLFLGALPLVGGRLRYPVTCPLCQEQSWPFEVWRRDAVECTRCGFVSQLAIPDPKVPWPEVIACERCSGPILTPQPSAYITH